MKNKHINNNKINTVVDKIEEEKKENDDEKYDKEIINKIKYMKEMIERTILAHNNYKVMEILSSNDLNMSIQYLEKYIKI